MTSRGPHFRHLSLHALKHNHHHLKVSHLLKGHAVEKRRSWPLLLGLLLIGGGFLIGKNIELDSGFSALKPAAPRLYTQGYEQGIKAAQGLSQIQEKEEEKGEPRIAPPPSLEGLANSLVSSTQLSQSGGAAPLKTALLQKSLLTTFYLGETTQVIEGALANDTQLLQEIKNGLAVDLFAYLNQSPNRADTLDNYLQLLGLLEQRAVARQNELTVTLNFLEEQLSAQEQVLSAHEEGFFTQLDQFQGPSAQKEFDDFVQLQEEQSRARAKAGVYQTLRDYYAYYEPFLRTRIEAVRANRDALIAGIKVVDIPGMDLGLILEKNEEN